MADDKPLRILVVDDEQHQLETVCRGLFLFGFICRGVQSVASALKSLCGGEDEGYDLVLTDLTMPGSSGLDLIEKVHARYPDLPIIVITGLAATEEIEAVREKGIPILQKPFEPDTLYATIRRVLGLAREPTG
jgi:DNA-binding NtrC family response regulator